MPTRPRKTLAPRVAPETLMNLARATAYLYFALQEAGRRIGAVNEANMGVWGTLSSLKTLGPRTVPELARERPVSRQYMQKVVDTLSTEGLVELVPNPAHKRSSLVRLTTKGERRFNEMNTAVRASFEGFTGAFSQDEGETALRVLGELRKSALAIGRSEDNTDA